MLLYYYFAVFLNNNSPNNNNSTNSTNSTNPTNSTKPINLGTTSYKNISLKLKLMKIYERKKLFV